MKYIYTLIYLVAFASCATTNYLTIEIKEAATVTFPNNVKNVLIVDNTAANEEAESDKNDPKLAIISNDSAKSIAINSLKKFMNEEKYFDMVDVYPQKINSNGSIEEIKPLAPSKVRSLCRSNKADAIISLDLYMVSAGVEAESVYFFNDYSLLNAQVGSILRVYGANGTMIAPPVVYMDSLFLESSENWSLKRSNISELNGLVAEISIKAADNLTGAFIPSWKTQERWYFSDSSSEMKRAAAFASEGKWEEAADIWRALYDNEKNSNKKAKLASNLALANECLDNISNALIWITTAYDLLPNKSASELTLLTIKYKEILSSREKNKSKLYEQLGLEIVKDTPADE
jgi:tetratricopeptide (TPR) repeat protein